MAFSRSLAVSVHGAWYSNTHVEACSPRPMRPRNWCNCDSPNRSACSTTISVALATSTPTSTTVVDTSNCRAPPAKARITCAFSSPFMRPCSSATVNSGNTRVSSSAIAVAAFRSIFSDSSTSG